MGSTGPTADPDIIGTECHGSFVNTWRRCSEKSGSGLDILDPIRIPDRCVVYGNSRLFFAGDWEIKLEKSADWLWLFKLGRWRDIRIAKSVWR